MWPNQRRFYMVRTEVLTSLLFIFALLAVEPARGYDPPKGLKWGMTYEEVVDKLKLQPKDDAIMSRNLRSPKDRTRNSSSQTRILCRDSKLPSLKKSGF
jgi:hypothetical protein